MQATATVQRWLGTACGVVLLAGVVAAAADSGADDPAVDAADAGSSTTAAPGAPGDPGATVTVAPLPGDPGTTAAPVPGAGGGDAAAEPPPAGTADVPQPPAVGEYHYDLSGSDGPSSSYVLHVDADADAPADRLVAAEGASLGLVERYRWNADGLYVIGGRFTALGDAGCEWQPPVLQLQAPVVAGAAWEGASDCVATTTVGDIAVHASTRTSVVELTSVDVAGFTRRAARISRDEDQVVTVASNTVQSTAHYDDVVDVATGIVISSSARATTEGQPESTSERHLTQAPPEW